jgi:hypothetical protein
MSSAPHSSAHTVEPPINIPRSGLVAQFFSFPVMCMFLLVGVVFGFAVRSIAEPDIWWHLRNGEEMVVHHTIPSVDTYSFGAAGSAWLDHEWLSEIPFFLAFRAAGLQGILALYFTLLVLIYLGVYYRTCREGADCKSATLTTLLAIFLGVVSIGPRILLFGWLCMVGLLLVLDHFQHTGKGLWLLPFLFAVWINLHGSWIFGMAVLGLTIAAGFVKGEWGLVVARRWTRAEYKYLLMATGASVVALFINPFGYRLPLYPFDLLFRQPSNLKYIEEWHSVDFGNGNGKLALLVILALLAAPLFSQRRWELHGVLLTAFALWAGLSHSRLLFFAGLVIPPLLASRFELFPPYDPNIDKPWLNAVIMVGMLGGMIYFSPPAVKLQQDVEGQYPAAALKFMRQHQLQGRIFNADWWGGYMEWNTPELKPFVDGRTDIFVYNGTFDDHVRAGVIQQPFEILNKYRIDYVLLEPKRPLTYLLEHSPEWKTIYSDKVAELFQRMPTSTTPSE